LNQTTRQRITGTLVLAVTALVLLPVIFDGEGSYQPSVQPEIPARPLQPQAAFQDAQRPEITADSNAIRIRPENRASAIISSENNGQSDETLAARSTSTDSSAVAALPSLVTTAAPTAEPTPAAPTQAAPTRTEATAEVTTQSSPPAGLDVQGLPEGWSVRLGSFSNADNVSSLVSRLQAAGHRAYTRRIESDQGALTAVFVGPQVDRSTAETLMERLRQDFQLNGMIVRYEIEEL
jgi:DedD protein